MTIDEFLQLLTQVTFVVIWVFVLSRAVRDPQRINIDSALFFGAIALIVIEQRVSQALGANPPYVVTSILISLLVSLPYLLVRLAADFADVPSLVMRGIEAGLTFSVAVVFATPPPVPAWLRGYTIIYFVIVIVFAGVVFVRYARRSRGATRQRMYAIGLGAALFGLAIAMAGASTLFADRVATIGAINRVLVLASAAALFVGFVPPLWLRRLWRERQSREFLAHIVGLGHIPDREKLVAELEATAAGALGVPQAIIATWREDLQLLESLRDGELQRGPSGRMIGGRAFAAQRAIYSSNPTRDDAEFAHLYREGNVRTIMAAPLTAGDRRIGVLVAHADRTTLFASDDLEMLQILAGQIAVTLENHQLRDDSVRMAAREELTRLKDEFISAVAHDLRSPVLALRLWALASRANPTVEAIDRMVDETGRMSEVIDELLDVVRSESIQISGERTTVDLVAAVREVCRRRSTKKHPCTVDADTPVTGVYDEQRIVQVLENLLGNAIKYSPGGGGIQVRVWQSGTLNSLSVHDNGIGIPPEDLPHIFERYQRARNVTERGFTGLGLGLYICQTIIGQHNGHIWAESRGPGQGSTFYVQLPREQAPNVQPGALETAIAP